MKKLLLTCACLSLWGIAALAEEVTITIGLNPSNSTSTTYLTSAQTFEIDGVTFEMNNYNPSSGQIRGNQNAAASNFYLHNTTAIPGELKSVSILSVSLASDKSFISTGNDVIEIPVTSGDAPASVDGNMVWSDLSGTYFGIGLSKGATSGTVKMTGVEIVYIVDDNYVPAPTFSINGGIVAAGTEVTLSTNVEGGNIYYATSLELGRDLTAANVVSKGTLGTSFTVSEPLTYYAVVEKDGNLSDVASATYEIFSTVHAGTLADPLDVADAIKVAKFYGTAGTEESYYVEGYVSRLYAPATDGTQSYYITNSETLQGDSFEIYKGKSIDGADFTADNAVELYDKIIAYGQIKQYNTTSEMVNGNLISLTRKVDPEIAWSADECDYILGESTAAALPTLSNPNNLTVTYASSNEDVATVSADGVVNVLTTGIAEITAIFTGNSQYKASSVSYTLNVTSAYTKTVTYNFTDEGFWTALGVEIPEPNKAYNFVKEGKPALVVDFLTMSFTDGTNTETRLFMSNQSALDLRAYDGGSITLTAANGVKIVSVAFNGGNPVTVNGKTYTKSGKGTYKSMTVEYEVEKVVDFDDDTYYAFPQAYTAEGVMYQRDIKDATKWQAICLPFAVPNAEWSAEYKVLALDGRADDKTAITFVYLTTEDLEANTPYLIKPINENASEIAFILTENVEVSAATTSTALAKGGATLIGNYGAYRLADGEYALADGAFQRAESNYNVLKAFRAYLSLPSNLKSIRIQIGEGETSSIETLGVDQIEDAVIYDLQGRKVANPAAGIYIANGKKVMVK